MPDAADGRTFRAGWSALHGGYEPAPSSLVDRWLRLIEAAARPLARAALPPDGMTLVGVAAAGVGSGIADSLDGAIAVLGGRSTAWGYVVDSLADRACDALYLAALRRSGAPAGLTTAAAASVVALEYGRARAASAG